MKDSKIIVECACGAEMMLINRFASETDFDLEIYRTWNPDRNFWKRIKIAFEYLFYAKQEVTGFCLRDKEALRLANFIIDTINEK